MNVKPIPPATTYAISSTNGATDGGHGRRDDGDQKEKKANVPDAKSADETQKNAAPPDRLPDLSQMVDSDTLVTLLGRRPTPKKRGTFVKTMAPSAQAKSVIDAKKVDKLF